MVTDRDCLQVKKFLPQKKNLTVEMMGDCAHNFREAAEKIQKIERGHYPASVMVWWGVSYEGVI